MGYISQIEFETINCLPIEERYNQCVNSITFKYSDNQCLHYLNEVFIKAPESSKPSRTRYHKLGETFP